MAFRLSPVNVREMTQGDVDQAGKRFERQCAEGRFPGGPLVVRHGGKEVVNVAVGVARGFRAAGAVCTLGWADPELGLAVAIVTNGNRGPYDSLFRFAPLGTLLRRAAR